MLFSGRYSLYNYVDVEVKISSRAQITGHCMLKSLVRMSCRVFVSVVHENVLCASSSTGLHAF